MKHYKININDTKRNIIIISSVLILLILGIIFTYLIIKKPKTIEVVVSSSNIISSKIIKPDLKASILATGDMLMHDTVISSAKKADGNYDFLPIFSSVKDIIKSYDFALCNIDGVMAGNTPYTGYPMFNCPSSFAKDMKDTGFKMVVTMNNHSYDRYFQGQLNTIQTLKQNGITPLGVKESADEKNYKIENINGINVGFMAYSYETNADKSSASLNGIPIAQEYLPLFNVFYPDDYEQELLIMKSYIEEMNSQSDVSIIYIHWGNEYTREPNEIQKAMAKKFIEYGIDIVFGDHPHVVQPYEKIITENKNEGHIFYSLGNFISDQNKAFTLDGIMATVEITKNGETSKTTISKVDFISTWVNKSTINGKLAFEILPIKNTLEVFSNKYSDNVLNSLISSQNNTKEMMKEIFEK